MKILAAISVAISLVSAGPATFPVPSPYRWDESFTVKMPQMDDEHRGLFNGILLIERENTPENLKAANIKYHDHFDLEESLFEQTMSKDYTSDHKKKHSDFLERFDAWSSPVAATELNWAKNWLVQHIKNTDFQYIDLLPHNVPKPYYWDDSFETFYARIDEEHKILFDSIRAVSHDPDSTKDLSDLKYQMRAHFDYESGLFCNSETYHDCDEHKKKHDTFYSRLFDMKNPVSKEDIEWAKNWLAQHIKNTDFQYKFKLNSYTHKVPSPYVWEEWLQVYYKDLDDEHVDLFKAIRDSVEHPADQIKYNYLYNLMKDHFVNEQAQFLKIEGFDEWAQDHIKKHDTFLEKLKSAKLPLDCDFSNFIENWLVQHIANTDFAYKGKLLHEVPKPFVWDESFMTFYKRLDDEHVKLFDCIQDSADHPDDNQVISNCKDLLRRHFDYEESEFCKVEDYDCYGHYIKHYNFQTKFQGAALPLDKEITDFAMNWLAQHIKNTDFAYRGKLHLRRHYVVPEPYLWDTSFTVEIPQMDDEHVGLFFAVRRVEARRNDQDAWDRMVEVFNLHFRNEEAIFSTILDGAHDIGDHRTRHLGLMKTIEGTVVPVSDETTEFVKNWLVQHIKNTDFSYMGKMPEVHPIPDPYVWDNSFAVMYKQMDEEHKPLFTCVAEIEKHPNDQKLIESCLEAYVEHFNHEQDLFTASNLYPDEEAYQHINKHNAFLATMRGLTTPVAQTWIDFAKNWLTQHIKNTDFRYKDKMPHQVNDPYVWDESFQVNYVRLDDEHKVLFDAMQKLGENPSDVDLLNYNRDVYRDHFDYEEKQFMACGEPCAADEHKKKHDVFFKTLTWVTTPVSQEYVQYAKNWLAQHIKNTDFKYRYKLPTQHTVPEPYIWNNEFEVSYQRLDDEHKVLFDAMLKVENNPGDQGLKDTLNELLRDHFFYEEKQFCDSLDLPWDYCKEHKKKHVLFSGKFEENNDIKWAQDWLVQHIKNTDFGYKGHLKHEVPEPYVWDESFATNYGRIDEEHDRLFATILEVSQQPDSVDALNKLKKQMKTHFDYEEDRFCSVPNFNCVDHKMKHYKFFVVLDDLKAPIDCEKINWAKNWLAQHIKNTDHQYKEKLIGADHGAIFSGI